MEVASQRQLKSVAAAAALSPDPIRSPASSGTRMLARKPSGTVPHARRQSAELSVRAIYDEHIRFVWLTLQRLGVDRADLEDVAQDVFMIVHRRVDSFDGTSRVTTWLFGICRRVAANYRRRRKHAPPVAIEARASEEANTQVGADEVLARRERRAIAEHVLAKLSLDKRAVFTMFEIEGLSCQEISELIGVPLGTVYSRLHGARSQVERALARLSSLDDDV